MMAEADDHERAGPALRSRAFPPTRRAGVTPRSVRIQRSAGHRRYIQRRHDSNSRARELAERHSVYPRGEQRIGRGFIDDHFVFRRVRLREDIGQYGQSLPIPELLGFVRFDADRPDLPEDERRPRLELSEPW